MSSSRLIRWSGLALLLAGLLIAIPMLLHPDPADPRAVLSNAWAPVHISILAGTILMLFGLIGLYARQSEQVGALGLAGFILAFISTILIAFVVIFEAFVVPAIAASPAGQALLDETGPLFGGPLGMVFLLMGISSALGTILLGVATFRAGALPRWVGLLLAIGGPLLAFSPPLSQPVGIAGALLVGASFVWAGYRIWCVPAQRALQPKAAM
jgi:hypothetical protein